MEPLMLAIGTVVRAFLPDKQPLAKVLGAHAVLDILRVGWQCPLPTSSPPRVKAVAVGGWQHRPFAAASPVRDLVRPSCILHELIMPPGHTTHSIWHASWSIGCERRNMAGLAIPVRRERCSNVRGCQHCTRIQAWSEELDSERDRGGLAVFSIASWSVKYARQQGHRAEVAGLHAGLPVRAERRYCHNTGRLCLNLDHADKLRTLQKGGL